jgi:alpha-beta hydrolase superfamily lysophospholipase
VTRLWQPPTDVATRGTVVLLPGRGEHAGVYERFGGRLASDAYFVYVLEVSSQDTVMSLRRQVDVIAESAVAPLVLAGSDTGALRVLELLRDGAEPDGILLAALPDPHKAPRAGERDWDWELAARTTCPAHRARLDGDVAFGRGSLAEPVPGKLASVLDETLLKGIGVPTLVLHGGADRIASPSHAAWAAELLPHAELAVVGSAPHDILNDATHRTVAAHVVQWLERLRGGPELAPIISVLTQPAPVRG